MSGVNGFERTPPVEPLVVSIPRQRPASKISAFNRLKGRTPQIRQSRVRAWLLELGQQPVATTARRIHRALYAQNRLDLSIKNRLSLAEPCAELVRASVSQIQHQLCQESIPLSDKGKRRSRLARRLMRELANAYKLVAMDHSLSESNTNESASDNQVVLLAVHRAIECLSMIVLHSALSYDAYSKKVWRDIYRLYSYAEKLNNTEYRLQNVLSDGEHSINELFLRVTLFGASDPYALTHGDSPALFAWLSDQGVAGSVTSRTHYADKNGKFLVDLSTDMPPVALGKVTRLDDETAFRVVDGSHVLALAQQLVESEIGDDEIPDHPGSIDAKIIEQAIRGWQPQDAGWRNDRADSASEVVLCAGVASTHYFMLQSMEFNPEQLFSDNLPTGLFADYNVKRPTVIKARGRGVESNADPTTTHAMLICHVIDQTPTGVRLRFHRSAGVHVRVRDLLGVQNLQTLRWRAGVVRWIRSHNAEFVDVGLQCWGTSAVPVSLLIEGEPTKIPGLVLSDQWAHGTRDGSHRFADIGKPDSPTNNTETIGSPVQLLTQSGYLLEQASVQCLFADGQKHWFTLHKLLEATEDIDRFVLSEEQWRQVTPIELQYAIHHLQ